MDPAPKDPRDLLRGALTRDRIHSGYLISGAGSAPRATAEWFARALACGQGHPDDRPCEACPACQKSRPQEDPPALDVKSKQGLRYRHIGEHPDLFWVERAPDTTRVRIDQVRELQKALRLGSNEGGRRVAVIADAEWLNIEAQNALLRLVEEPPDGTSVLLVTRRATVILPTIRSRCIRVAYPSEETTALRGDDAPEEVHALAQRFDGIGRLGLPELLEWAEEYRGARAVAAAEVELMLETGTSWVREQTRELAREPGRDVRPLLDAFKELTRCQRDLSGRNANPQMVAERGLFAVRSAIST
jgi:DNA polymerase-3 subunit delta'